MARRPRPKRASAPRHARGKSHSAPPLSPALLESLIERNSDAIALLDATGTVLYANQTATHVLGHPVLDMIGRSAFDLVHPEDTARARQLFADVIARPGIAVTAPLRCSAPDGAARRLEAVGVNRLDDPVVGAVILTYRDVTDRARAEVEGQEAESRYRKRAEDALRSAEDRYRAFIAQSTEGIWQFELERPAPVDLPPDELAERLFRDGYLAECNDAMAQMYGFRSARDIIGARLDSLLVRSDPKNIEFLHAFVASNFRLTDVESHERDREGHPKIFLNNMIGIVEDGAMVRAWGTQRDITEQRRLEEQIRQAVKVEAVGRLAGGIAHDFNNILTAILGTTQLLQRELGPEAPHYADVEEIRLAAERAADLTRQLLAYSRRQVLAPRVLDLNAVVLGLDHMLHRLIGEDMDLTNTLAPHLAPVRADPGQLEQVIVNLAINARDAMPSGGTLTVDTANVEIDAAFARTHPGAAPGSYVRLRVLDTGVGMDAETRAHLFEPFFTTKSVGKGTGLGLATVYGIVKQSGGYIWVDSEPGRGTVFTILLPRTSGTPEPAASTDLPGQPARGTETILLVEDEETVRTLSDRALNKLGYSVLAAPSGWDALQVAERHRGPIHLVLTDVVMPGLSGRELVRQLAAVRPGMQVLYISGYSDEAIAQHGVLDPGTAFLQKPFTPDRLASKVREVIDAAKAPLRAAKTP